MNHIKLLLITLTFSINSFAQSNPQKVFRLTSNICQLFTRESVDEEFTKKDIIGKHVIVLDLDKSSVDVYQADSLMTNILILSRKDVDNGKSFSTLYYNGIDERNIKCDIKLCLNNDKGRPFFISIIYPRTYFTFYFD